MNNKPEEATLQEQIYDALKRVLDSGRLKSRLAPVRVFQNKAYISRDGWSESSLDVTIEAGQLDSKDGSALLAFVCLDGEGYLTRNEVLSCYDQLEKIGGSAAAFIVTTRALRKDAFKEAGSRGIGIVRLLPDSQVLWLNINMSPLSFREYDRIDANDFMNALLDPTYMGQNRAFYGFGDNHLFGDWSSLLAHHLDKSA